MPRKKGNIQRICGCCGKMFTVSAEFKTYCSAECQRIVRGERDKRYSFERRKREFELAHPGEIYAPRHYNKNSAPKKPTFADHLIALKAEGKDYVEEQRRQTIEMYARVII